MLPIAFKAACWLGPRWLGGPAPGREYAPGGDPQPPDPRLRLTSRGSLLRAGDEFAPPERSIEQLTGKEVHVTVEATIEAARSADGDLDPLREDVT